MRIHPGSRLHLRLLWRRAAAVCVITLTAGCGGSLSLGFGDLGRAPPSVALTASRTTVAVGETAVLVAAATDQEGVDRVEFFRNDGASTQLLATATVPPYQVEIGFNTTGSQVFFARAYNVRARRSDSNSVTINVNP